MVSVVSVVDCVQSFLAPLSTPFWFCELFEHNSVRFFVISGRCGTNPACFSFHINPLGW